MRPEVVEPGTGIPPKLIVLPAGKRRDQVLECDARRAPPLAAGWHPPHGVRLRGKCGESPNGLDYGTDEDEEHELVGRSGRGAA